MTIAAITIALLLVIFVALSVSLASPAQARIGPPPDELGADVVSISGGADAEIKGWYSPGTPGCGSVLLLHPVRGNRTSMLGRGLFLHRNGFGVLLIDLQAHGETLGKHITFGALESKDAADATEFLRSHAPGERIGAIGWSLGGAATLLGRGPLTLDALVLEAVYPTIEEATADRLRIRLGGVGPLFAPLLTSQLNFWTGVSAQELRPIEQMPKLRSPLLLIAGERDPRTPLSESRRMFAAAPEPKVMWVVPGAAHDDFYATHTDEYQRQVLGFLTPLLRSPGVICPSGARAP